MVNGQGLNWLEQINNVDDDIDVHSMTLSSTGNIFIGGSYDEQVASNGSTQGVKFGTLIPATSDEQNGFLAKYNNSGAQQWLTYFGTPNSTSGYSPLAMVENAGFLYVVGSFKHATGSGMDFDPGAGTLFYTSQSSNTDFFVSKYNSSNGSLVWTYVGAGTAGSDLPSGIDVDASGNIYVTGKVANGSTPVDFDIKSGTAASANGIASKVHLYLVKYDADCNFQWRVNVLNSSDNSGGALVVDRANSFVYMAGGIGENSSGSDPNFSGTTLNVDATDDGFIAKYNLLGTLQWVKNIAASTSPNWVRSIDVDGAGALYVSGTLQGTADYDPTAGTFNMTAVGSHDAFFAKYSSAGTRVWSYKMGSSSFGESGYGIDVNTSGELVIGGAMYGAADYNPEGTGGAQVKGANGSRYAFIGVYDTAFVYSWCNVIGNASITANLNYTQAVKFDDNAANCAVYGYGYMARSITEDFDPNNAGGSFTSTGTKENGFFVQYGNCPNPLPVELLNFDASPYKRTVLLDWTTVSEINNDYFEVERSVDVVNFEYVGTIDGVGNSQQTENYSMIDYSPYDGVSYYRLKQFDFNGEFEYSQIRVVKFNGGDDVIIFPNPTSGSFSVYSTPDGSHVSIVSMNGKLVREITTDVVDVEDIANGVYFVRIQTEEKIISKKLVINQ